MSEQYSREHRRRVAIWAGELWRFVREINAGDVIVTPYADRRYVRIGLDEGRYTYRPEFPPGTRHARGVRWLAGRVRRIDLPKDISRSLGTPLTVAHLWSRNAAERLLGRSRLAAAERIAVSPPYRKLDLQPNEEVQAVVTLESPYGPTSLPPLTVGFIESAFLPFLAGIDILNRALQRAHGSDATPLTLVSLRQRTPVEVNLEGVARETLEILRDDLVPWRKDHNKKMAALDAREREAEAAWKEAQTEEAREAVEAKRIENARARFQLGSEKLDYALGLAARLAPNATPGEQMQLALQITAAVDKIAPAELTLLLSDQN
jgi:hypothetical protein